MIIQCEQCRTKFRLDDSKIKENGVKVRCAKCRHVFTVMKEQPETTEQSDFGAMLEQSASLGGAPQGEAFTPPQEMAAEGFQQEQPSEEENPFAAAPQQPESAPDFDFGSFEPPAEEPPAPESPAEPFAFSTPEPQPGFEENPPSPPADFQFGEVDFGQPAEEQPAASAQEPFPATEEPAPQSPFGDEFDFQPLDSRQEQEPAQTAPETPPALHGEIDFGEVDFGQPAEQQTSVETAPEFSPTQESEPPEQTLPPLEFEFGLPDSGESTSSVLPETSEAETLKPAAAPAGNEFDFAMELPTPPSDSQQQPPNMEDAFSFDSLAQPAAAAAPESAPTAPEQPLQPEPRLPAEEQTAPPIISAPETGAQESPAAQPEPAQEELPPLSIPSRRKSSSTMKLLVALLVLVAIGAAAFYGKDYYPMLKQKFFPESGGKITIRSVRSSFIRNTTTGSELLVISGEAVNDFGSPRSSLQVKGMVYGDKDQLLVSKNAYCGNPLTIQQLSTMPQDAIEMAMANQVGSGLSNLEVAPGKSIPFTVVIVKVPEGAKNIGIVPAGSQPLGDKPQ